MNYSKISIALFGSTVRGDTDKYSDRDLIIIHENSKAINPKSILEYIDKASYSISYYNYEKLEYLSKSKSMFMLHLKEESIIIRDDEGRFKDILSTFVAKPNYSYELENSKEYFEFLQFAPDSVNGIMWYLDCLFVGVRNYLVCRQIENEKPIFSYVNIVDLLYKQNTISDESRNFFLNLRVIKHNYRKRKFGLERGSFDCIPMALNSIGISFNPELKSIQDYFQIAENKLKANNISNYQKLRLLEGMYILKDKKNITLENVFQNPQLYTSQFKSTEKLNFYLSLVKKL